ncbi:hypothetical protein L9F63_015194 [Diploptera punctata]|uniref:Gustatory receptor n=1 Tax=Diploptera punctata TaxID=6984 RepID=A0AAD8EK65_DIPPU|nr:hypothetical protein L9F63_015194 [Diploptera punctata]
MDRIIKLKPFIISNKILHKRNIFETVKPLIYISKIIGLAPYSYTQFGDMEVTFLGTMHCYFMCSLLVVFFIITFNWNVDFSFKNFNLVIGIVHMTDACLSSCTLFVAYLLCATINRSKVIKFFTLINEVDKRLIKSTCIYTKTSLYLSIIIFCYVTFTFIEIVLFTFTSLKLENYYYLHLVYFSLHLFDAVGIFQFVFTVLILEQRFSEVNKEMLKIFGVDGEQGLDEYQMNVFIARNARKNERVENENSSESSSVGDDIIEDSLEWDNVTVEEYQMTDFKTQNQGDNLSPTKFPVQLQTEECDSQEQFKFDEATFGSYSVPTFTGGNRRKAKCLGNKEVIRDFANINKKESKFKRIEEVLNSKTCVSVSDLRFRVRALCSLHSILCDASRLTNSTYQILLLMDLIGVFVEITSCLYATLIYVTKLLTCQLFNPSRWSMLTLYILWASVNLVKLLTIVASCSLTSKTANHTAVLVHKLMLINSEVTNELQVFSQQLLHRKLHFSACGFFRLDFTLLYSMVGAVTTYIIILLQYTGHDVDDIMELCNKTSHNTI